MGALNISSNVTETQVYINVTFNALITAIAIPSNFIIVLLFWRYARLRDMNNTAVTMLSGVDLVRGCIVQPVVLYNHLTRVKDPQFHENPVMCHITAVITTFSCVFCPLLLAWIAYVRYNTIVPGNRCFGKLTPRKFNITSVALLLVAILFSILPYMGVGEYSYSESHGICFVDWRCTNGTFRTLLYTLIIGVAFPVLAISYARLFVALRRHTRGFQKRFAPDSYIQPDKMTSVIESQSSTFNEKSEKTQSSMGVAQRSTCDDVNVSGSNETHRDCEPNESDTAKQLELGKNVKNREIAFEAESTTVSKTSESTRLSKHKPSFVKNLSRQEYRVTTLLILIFISYCVSWFPVALINVLAITHIHLPMVAFYVAVTMVELKSALDPMIYGLGNRRYRNAFMNLVRSRKVN